MSPDKTHSRKKLRTGFTTGTAAAAAAAGALQCLLTGTAPETVSVTLLTGETLAVAVHSCRRNSDTEALCTVIKDAGDDPDVTHRAEIGAVVRLGSPPGRPGGNRSIVITGGRGVGRATKPGPDIPPGAPAINPGPMKMIRPAVTSLLDTHRVETTVTVEVFVPEGARLAEKTLNRRLDIMGGISILGTTGIVRPMSHKAYIATVASALSVAAATGNRMVVLTTGRRSERFAQRQWPGLPEEAFIQIGDFFSDSLEKAAAAGFDRIVLAVFFAKAVKMAQGVPHTHAAKAALTLAGLSRWTIEMTGDAALARKVAGANTARHALEMIWPAHPELVARTGTEMIRAARRFAGPGPDIRGVIFQYDGSVMFDSTGGKGCEES